MRVQRRLEREGVVQICFSEGKLLNEAVLLLGIGAGVGRGGSE